MPVSNDELINSIMRPIHDSFKSNGITVDYLTKKLKRELNAKKTEKVKLKGAVSEDGLPKGFKLVCVTGTIINLGITDAEGKPMEVAGDGDTLIHYDVIDWSIRQKARMDAHKLMNHYPASKHELTGKNGGPIETKLTNFPKEPGTIAEWERQVAEADKLRNKDQSAESDEEVST